MELCDHCLDGELELIEADPPWTIEHYQCKICDSTYNVEYEVQLELTNAL